MISQQLERHANMTVMFEAPQQLQSSESTIEIASRRIQEMHHRDIVVPKDRNLILGRNSIEVRLSAHQFNCNARVVLLVLALDNFAISSRAEQLDYPVSTPHTLL